MTKPRPPHPEPTSDSGYSIYLWPRSKNPNENWVYDWLAEHDWRFDARTMLWYTPEDWTMQGYGILERPTPTSFRIQPASEIINGVPHRPHPLLSVTQGEP